MLSDIIGSIPCLLGIFIKEFNHKVGQVVTGNQFLIVFGVDMTAQSRHVEQIRMVAFGSGSFSLCAVR